MDFRKVSNISVDCVIIGLGSNGINILLTQRQLKMYDNVNPIIDDWVLVGDQVLNSEKLDVAANRIFNEQTDYKRAYKIQFRTFGGPDRINNEKDILWLKSRGLKHRIISIAYYFMVPLSQVKLKKENAKWFALNELPKLGFDHTKIIKLAMEDIRLKAVTKPIIFELLEDKFTLNDLHFVYQSLLGIEIDNRNFRKKAISKTYIVPLEEKRVVNTAKKPAKLYMFSKDIYKKLKDTDQVNYLNFTF